MDEYLQNKILGGFVFVFTTISSIIYLFLGIVCAYNNCNKIVAIIPLLLIIVLYFVAHVEWNSEFYENLGRDTKPVRG